MLIWKRYVHVFDEKRFTTTSANNLIYKPLSFQDKLYRQNLNQHSHFLIFLFLLETQSSEENKKQKTKTRQNYWCIFRSGDSSSQMSTMTTRDLSLFLCPHLPLHQQPQQSLSCTQGSWWGSLEVIPAVSEPRGSVLKHAHSPTCTPTCDRGGRKPR